MKIAVIGAGGWGTALAIQAQKKNEVTLWVHTDVEARPLLEKRENPDYLPGVKIPESVRVTTDIHTAAEADILLFVTPSKFFRSVAARFKPAVTGRHILVSATKGFEFPTEKRMSVILAEEFHQYDDIVVISGPSHAEEVAKGVPTTIVAASDNEKAAEVVQEALSADSFRMYRHDDVIGVEVSAAVKNVIAIAAGCLRGLGFGDNTMAALITRGLAEIRRLGLKMGAKEATFAGLAGVGDLIVTCISKFSRNGRTGEELAKGRSIEDILASTKMVAEGVETVKSVAKLEEELGIDMPISRAVYDVIYNRVKPMDSIKSLLNRPLKNEWM
jgi:glycerol-3-phosphate dehydrogenase (NAD(P)+)